MNIKRFQFSTGLKKNTCQPVENSRTFFTSTESTNYHRPDSRTERCNEDLNGLNSQISSRKNTNNKEEEFFKPVDFDFMTNSEKKSFHYDVKIFSKKNDEDSIVYNSDTREFPRESKSFSYSRFKKRESFSGNKQVNLGVDPFSTSFKIFNPEVSYENSFFQNENVGEINVPNKKSFHFINKFSQKEKQNPDDCKYYDNSNKNNEKLISLGEYPNVQKIELGTSITEFGGKRFFI